MTVSPLHRTDFKHSNTHSESTRRGKTQSLQTPNTHHASEHPETGCQTNVSQERDQQQHTNTRFQLPTLQKAWKNQTKDVQGSTGSNDTIEQPDLGRTDPHRTRVPTAGDCTASSVTHRTFSRINHIRSQRSLEHFQKIKTTPSIFSNHSGMKRQIKNRRETAARPWKPSGIEKSSKRKLSCKKHENHTKTHGYSKKK